MMRPTQRMTGALIPGTVLHSREDVQRMQDGISRYSILIDNAASSCASLPADQFQGWRLQGYVPAQQYAQADVPSVLNQLALNTMIENGIGIRKVIDAWAVKIKGYGCNVALVETPKPYEDLITAAKWGVGAVVTISVIALIIKLANVVEAVEK
jgi:hypothetical protein